MFQKQKQKQNIVLWKTIVNKISAVEALLHAFLNHRQRLNL